ncbi:hypothetical protein [Streptomyces sp. NBC_00209]|uniref:hypothetical protein n=1 Tax=Streptomyces sp. NBC_00209 TaxID=2975682 RepID=UPI003250214A
MERAGALAPLLFALLEKDPARRPTVDVARELLIPPPRPPEQRTKPWDQARREESVTVANKQSEIAWAYSKTAGKIGGYTGLGIGGILAALTFPDPVLSLGSLELVGDDRLQNVPLGAAVLGSLLGFVCWLGGLIAGARAKSDIITLDAHGLTVSSRRWNQLHRLTEGGTPEPPGPETFTLRWGALERIAVEYPRAKEPAAIAVWFRPAAKPSKAWRNKHDVEKRQGGGVWVYRNHSTRPHPRTVNPERLRNALKHYAGALYEDPHDVPDP